MSIGDLNETDASGHYPEQSEAAKTIAGLKLANERTLERIGTLGASIDPAAVAQARDGYLSEWIYENVLTEAQREDFLIAWHTKFAESLGRLEGQARESQVARTRARLATPRPGKIIVPGQ